MRILGKIMELKIVDQFVNDVGNSPKLNRKTGAIETAF
jgi:hypothetical protein